MLQSYCLHDLHVKSEFYIEKGTASAVPFLRWINDSVRVNKLIFIVSCIFHRTGSVKNRKIRNNIFTNSLYKNLRICYDNYVLRNSHIRGDFYIEKGAAFAVPFLQYCASICDNRKNKFTNKYNLYFFQIIIPYSYKM